MEYLRRRERRRLLDDLIDLEREDDLQRQCQAIMYHLKKSERHRFDFDDEYRHRRKEYCLVKLIYRNPTTRHRRHLDEIMITQHNRTIFKGCLRDGDELTFKSKHYRNESKLKLKFYINDLLEDEMIGCCEYGLKSKNRYNHLFQIENIIGSKPCHECEFDDKTSKTSSFNSRSSSSELSEDQSNERKPKEKKSTLSVPQIHNKKTESEGFSANVIEFSDYHSPIHNQSKDKQESDEDSIDTLTSNEQISSKRTYGPPQLSTMLSLTESLDSPSLNIHESRSEKLFNSTYNQTESNLSRESSNTDQQETSMNSNNIAIANDATELLLTRLGIIRQQQIQRSEASYATATREQGNVEYFTLIYLHSSHPDESIIKHLRSFVNFLKIYDDIDDCVAFINSVSNEKILLILSNSFQNLILPRIEGLQQIFTIYILCENQDQIDSSSKQSKIQGFYTNLNAIYEQISNDINKITRDLIIYLLSSTTAVSLEPILVYSLLLSEIILDKSDTKNELKELINFARNEYEGNEEELQMIDEFEKNYQKNQAIYWFSRPCFLSKMLNKALRIPEVDILFRFRLFIQDLFQQIQNQSISDSITVYLGQTIQRDGLDDLQKNILNNNLIIFPQFLFASTDKSQAIRIAKEIPLLNEDYIPLVIHIDIPEDSRCANISSPRYSIDENNNVLLNMGTAGCLMKIEKDNINEDQIASVHLRLVKLENEKNIQQILEVTRAEVKSFSAFVTMIKLMMKMNQQTSAEQIVRTMFDDDTLIEDLSLQGSIAASSAILAQSRRDQEDYKLAVEFYLLSLNAFLRIIPSNALELSTLYSNIAALYFRLNDYDKTHEYYQKALDIQIHSNTPDFYSISSFTNSIGITYSKQGKYFDAIKYFERTLKILQQSSQPHDNELALTYDDLGDVYLSQLKYEDALNNYNKALEIYERIQPRSAQRLGTSSHTIGSLYLKIGRSKEALIYLKRAVEYHLEYLPAAHATLALLYNNIGLMYYREEQYSDALKSYSKSLEIAAIALPENHSLVGITLFNIGLVYSSEEKFDEAIESIEKSTEQFLKTLSPDHSDVMENNKYIQSIKQKKILRDIFDENTTSF